MSKVVSKTDQQKPFALTQTGLIFGYFPLGMECGTRNEKVNFKLQNIARVLGYIPGIGIIVGFVELVLSAKEIKICNAKLKEIEHSEHSEDFLLSSGIQSYRRHQISRLIRSIFTTLSLGIFFLIPDLVVYDQRRAEFRKRQNSSTNIVIT